MESFKVSRSRYRKVYGLPTLRGLVLAGLLAAALFFSIANNSETERWLFLLMILLVLVHLTESSQPFRFMQVKILPFEPPFEGETATIPVQISNQTEIKLDLMMMKFNESGEWREVPALARHSTTVISLPFQFTDSGENPLPRIILRTSPVPKLFRYWRYLDLNETTFVLPKPIDHHIASKPLAHLDDDVELADIEQIRDERLMPLMDQKLFLKTGIPYRKVHRSLNSSERLSLTWSHLEKLSHEKKGEQFSFWMKAAAEEKRPIEVSINTPFMQATHGGRTMDWRSLKTLFAKWFYAQP